MGSGIILERGELDSGLYLKSLGFMKINELIFPKDRSFYQVFTVFFVFNPIRSLFFFVFLKFTLKIEEKNPRCSLQ